MDAQSVEDFFAAFARVRAKRMFSGHGVYIDDACFALCVMGDIWIKTDRDDERERLKAAGSRPFAYEKSGGRIVTLNAFWSLPGAALDDDDELRRWCGPALEAARRTAAQKAAAKAREAARPKMGAATRSRRASTQIRRGK